MYRACMNMLGLDMLHSDGVISNDGECEHLLRSVPFRLRRYISNRGCRR